MSVIQSSKHCSFFCAIVVSLAIPTLASSQSNDKIVIEIGTTSVPSHAESWFRSQIESYVDTHPNISVETLALADPQRPLNPIETIPRLAENVIGLQVPYEEELSYLLDRDLIVPIESFLPDSEFTFDLFYENAWPPVRRYGKTWGVPWNMDAMWLVCYWPAFEEEGIKAPPSNWEEFISYAHRLTKDTNGDGTTDQWGVRLDTGAGTAQLLWLTLDLQNGVRYEQSDRLVINQPQVRKNLEFLKRMYEADYVHVDSRNRFVASDYKKYAMRFMHNFLRYLPRTSDQARRVFTNKDLRFAFVPSSGSAVDTIGPRYYLAIRRSTPEKERASWEFIKWINRENAELPPYWFGFPCRKDFLDREDVLTWGQEFSLDWDISFRSMERTKAPASGIRAVGIFSALAAVQSYLADRSTLDSALQSIAEVDFLIPSEEFRSRSDIVR